MESIALKIERGSDRKLAGMYMSIDGEIPIYSPYGHTRYTLVVTPDSEQRTVQTSVVDECIRAMPRTALAGYLVDKLVVDYRERLIRKLVSVL